MELSTKSSVITKDQSNILLFLSAFIGISLMISGFYVNYQRRALYFYGSVPGAIRNYFKEYYPPKEVDFISIGVRLPIKTSVIKDGTWNVDGSGANHLSTSAKPGEGGNIILYGTDSKNVFGPIKNIKEGSFINLKTENGDIHSYIVKSVSEVSPSKVEVLKPTDHEVLTVFTSSGLLNSKRLVVKAYPINTR